MSRIYIDPRIRSGKPCIRGTRITVYDVLEYMASGMSNEQITSEFAEFAELTEEDLRAVMLFAAERKKRLTSGSW